MIKEITTVELDPQQFIERQIASIRETVGSGKAYSALSGGVDSWVVSVLAHMALGEQLTIDFVQNGLMRRDEAEQILDTAAILGMKVNVIDEAASFFQALQGIIDPEEKREAITQTFYRHFFARRLKEIGAKILMHGTILTDVDETVAGVKRQHNIFVQIGIDPEKEFGYQIVEPLLQLRKDGVRLVAKALNLPQNVCTRIPFPGPALATRIIGEVTPERVKTVRMATGIVEEMLGATGAFQYLAILHNDRVTGMVDGQRVFGQQIEVRCWDSVDAREAKPTEIPLDLLFTVGKRLVLEIPDVVSATYNIAEKPPSTIEAV